MERIRRELFLLMQLMIFFRTNTSPDLLMKWILICGSLFIIIPFFLLLLLMMILFDTSVTPSSCF